MKFDNKEINKYIFFLIILIVASICTFGVSYYVNIYGDNYVEEK